MVQELDPSGRGGEIFHTCPGAYLASYTVGSGSSLRVQCLGCGIDHTPPSSAKVKERVELYIYSTSGHLWPVLG